MESSLTLTYRAALFACGFGLAISGRAYGAVHPKAKVNAEEKSSCVKRMVFDEHTKKLLVPASMPLKFLLTPPASGDSAFPLGKTAGDGEQNVQFPEGEHQISIPASDAKQYKIVSDGTAPKTIYDIATVPNFQKNSTLFYGKGMKLTLKPTDNSVGVQSTFFSLNTPSFSVTQKLVYQFESDGDFAIAFYSCDRVGNGETPTKMQFVVDVTPPESKLVFAGKHEDNLLGIGAQIVITATDRSSGVASTFYSIDGGAEITYDSPIPADLLKQGAHKLVYYSVDNVNNREAPRAVSFTFDSSPPEIKLVYEGKQFREGDTTYVSGSTKLTFKTSDAYSKHIEMTCQIDNKDKPKACHGALALPEANGLHKLLILGNDDVGNQLRIDEKTYIDRTAPDLEYEIKGPYLREGDVAQVKVGTHIALQAHDKGAGVGEVKYCSKAAECHEYKSELVMDKVGLHNFTFIAKDRVGNESKALTLKVHVIDAPKTTVANQDIGVKKSWVADAAYGAIGPQAKAFQIQIADGPGAKANVFTLELPEDVMTTLAAEAHQHIIKLGVAGHEGTVKIPVDDAAPHTSIQYTKAKRFEAEGKMFFGAGLHVDLFAKEPTEHFTSGVKTTYQDINGHGIRPYSSTLQEFNSEQEYELTYFSVDRVGNDEKHNVVKFTVDLTPPKTKVALGKPFFHDVVTRQGGVTLAATDNLSGVRQIHFAFDDGKMAEYSEAKCLAALQKLREGSHVLKYFAVDNVANQEPVNSFEFNLDTEVPQLAHTVIGNSFAKESVTYVSPGARFAAKATDAAAGMEKIDVIADGAAPFEYKEPVVVPADKKSHVFTLTASDRVEHVSKPTELKLQVDDESPETAMKFEGPHFSFEKMLFLYPTSKIVLTAKDGGSGVKEIFYRFNSGAFLAYEGPIKLTSTEEFDLTYYAIDKVGNKEPAHQFHIVVDQSKPQVDIEVAAKKKGEVEVVKQGAILRVAAIDRQAGVKEVYYQINGKGKKLYRGPIKATDKGPFKLEIFATDWVNNEQKMTLAYLVE